MRSNAAQILHDEACFVVREGEVCENITSRKEGAGCMAFWLRVREGRRG